MCTHTHMVLFHQYIVNSIKADDDDDGEEGATQRKSSSVVLLVPFPTPEARRMQSHILRALEIHKVVQNRERRVL